MSRRAGLLAAGAAVCALLVLPVSSPAAVTIGSDLAPDPDAAVCPLNNPCTVTNSVLPGAAITSPLDGVIVQWRVRADTSGEPVILRLNVLRPGAGGVYTSVGVSGDQTFSDVVPTTRSYPANLRVAVGDQISLDIVGTPTAISNFSVMPLAATPGAERIAWAPPLAPGDTRPPDFTGATGEILINADIEPDCDSDGLGDESQDADIASCTPAVIDVPPDTTITGGPDGKTRKKKATFTYTGTDASGVSGFQCKLDDGAFESCGASKTYTGLKKGRHTFSVRAVDTAGNVDPTPATRTWKVKKKRKRKR